MCEKFSSIARRVCLQDLCEVMFRTAVSWNTSTECAEILCVKRSPLWLEEFVYKTYVMSCLEQQLVLTPPRNVLRYYV